MELWDVYDKDRNKVGRTHLRGNTLENGDYHLVVHVWIVNSDGLILVSQRHPSKPFGNLWECVGGSVLAGESSLEGALREVNEEIGISLSPVSGRILRTERREYHKDFYDI